MAEEGKKGSVFGQIAAVLATLTGIVGIIGELQGKLEALLPRVLPPVLRNDSSARYTLLALLVLAGVYVLFRRRRERAARSQTAAAGVAETAEALPFSGRDLDTRNLLGYCNNYRLVFLRGVSGVGKSTLISNGLAEALEDSPFQLFHMRYWGDSWDEGPQRWLATVLQKNSADLVDGAGLSAPEDFPAYVRRLHKRSGKTPLVVFDQFDDYQVRFRESLYLAKESRYLTPAELVARNPFWAQIAELLEDGVLHCVFVTRSDVVGALSSVRFVDPLQEMDLQRLDAAAATELVTAQLPSETLHAADRALLVRQLVSDLDDGGVLPAELRSACGALRHLKPLNFASYALKRLTGIQIDDLARRVAVASQAAGIETATTHAILFAMVDAQPTPPKARMRSEQRLLDAVPEHVDGKALERLLNALKDRDVVRPIPSEPPRWTLYHDYVARIVKELHVRADRWTVHLEAARRGLAAATGVLARWRALLAPSEQLQLLYHRFVATEGKGRFRFGQYRPLMTWSALRWAPYLVSVIALVVVFGRIDRQGRAEDLAARFAFGTEFPTTYEVEALWDLRAASHDLQDDFLRAMLAVPDRATRFAEHGDMVVHAIVDMNLQRREQVLQFMRTNCHEKAALERHVVKACIRLTLSLESTAAADWHFVIDAWLTELRRANQASARQDPTIRAASFNTTRWLADRGHLARMPEFERKQMVSNAVALASQPGANAVTLQQLSGVLSQADLSLYHDEVKRLQGRLRALVVNQGEPKEDNIRRIIAWWPLARELSDDAELDFFASLLLTPAAQRGDIRSYMDRTSRQAWGEPGNLLLIERLDPHIQQLGADRERAWKALARMLPAMLLSSREKGQAERLQRAAQPATSEHEPVAEPPPAQRAAAVRLQLEQARVAIEELGQTEMAERLLTLYDAFASLEALRTSLGQNAAVSSEEVAQRLYADWKAQPAMCAYALNTSLLLGHPTLALIKKSEDDSEALRMVRACIVAAEALRRGAAEPREKARTLDAERQVEQMVAALEAGRDVVHTSAAINDEGLALALADGFVVRVFAMVGDDLRARRNVANALAFVYDHTRTAARKKLLHHMLTRAVNEPVGKSVRPTVSLLLRITDKEKLFDEATAALTKRLIQLIVVGSLRDEEAGDELAQLMNRVGERSEVGEALGVAMLKARDQRVLTVLLRGVVAGKSVLRAENAVRLLRRPICVGGCRRCLLSALAKPAQRPLSGWWDAVAWAKQQHFDLEVTAVTQAIAAQASDAGAP